MTKRLAELGVAGMLVLVACGNETPVVEQTGTGCTTDRGSIVLAAGGEFTRVVVGGPLGARLAFEPTNEGGRVNGSAHFDTEAGVIVSSSRGQLFVAAVGPPGSSLSAGSDEIIPCEVDLGKTKLLALAIPNRGDVQLRLDTPLQVVTVNPDDLEALSEEGTMMISTP